MQEKIIVGQGGEFPLNGLLTIPDEGNTPFPAVVLVQGSGPSDMNSKVYKVEPFKDLAEGIAKQGVASIRYDKRTFVYGKKWPTDGTVEWETNEDAILATTLLKNDPRIDSSKVFFAGISMGGTIAPRIDQEDGDYKGLIIMAGTPRRLEEVMRSQQADFLSKSKGLIKWIATKQINKLNEKFNNIYNLTDEEAKKTPILGKHVMAYYLKDMGQPQVREYFKVTLNRY
jgi:dienelactone hydrolase